MFAARLIAALGAGALLGSCGPLDWACTEVGCGDGLSIVIAPREGPWTTGQYELSLTLAGQTHLCKFPLLTPSPGPAGVVIACTPVASVRLDQAVECSETKHPDGSRSDSCTPIPDRAELRASFSGTPAEIAIKLVHDDLELLNQQQPIRYRSERPNGPRCEPVCQRAELQFSW